MSPLPSKVVVVTALGVTQILAWGSTFYLLGVLAPVITRDTGWPYDVVFGGVSVGMLVAALVSPRVGRLIARHGGRPVMAASSLLLAVGLFGLGAATSLPAYLAAWAVIGIGMGAGLYDAAFSTIGSIYGTGSRDTVTSVTLFGGFASTVCWPISAILVEQMGWRGACLTYAAIHIAVALPIHLLFLPRRIVAAGPVQSAHGRLEPHEVTLFLVLSASLTISASILSMMGTHLLPLLQARGLDLASAVGIGMIVGPAQVGARLVEMIAGRRYHPIWTMVSSAVLIACAAVMLLAGFPLVGLTVALYAAGSGIGSIARGTVPMALFGPARYAVLMGRLGLPLMIAMAISPFIGGLAFQYGGAFGALALLVVLAVANVVLAALLWAFGMPKTSAGSG